MLRVFQGNRMSKEVPKKVQAAPKILCDGGSSYLTPAVDYHDSAVKGKKSLLICLQPTSTPIDTSLTPRVPIRVEKLSDDADKACEYQLRLHDCISLLKSRRDLFRERASISEQPTSELYENLCLELDALLEKSSGWTGQLETHRTGAYRALFSR